MTKIASVMQSENYISTHILTRRMTLFNQMYAYADAFQLTSSWGGWRQTVWQHLKETLFQLTSSRGGWRTSHILTRRMTAQRTPCIASLAFQLTSSRGGWRYMYFRHRQRPYFNSHPHEEDDLLYDNVFMIFWIFQLTSSRGGWRIAVLSITSVFVFQLTSSRGGWLFCTRPTPHQNYFNSHPHEEDDVTSLFSIITQIFQLTSSRGGWQKEPSAIGSCFVFQLTSSRGGWRLAS